MPRNDRQSGLLLEASSIADSSLESVFSMTDESSLEERVEELFLALREPVFHYLLSVFGDARDAEDVTQDSFLKLFTALSEGQKIRDVRFWIFRVAHNLAINKRKHLQFVSTLKADTFDEFERIVADSSPNPEQLVLNRERYERVFNGLKRLTLNERQCLFLRAEGFRYREIAEIMEVGVPTVGEYLRRSIRKLGGQSGE